MTVDKVRRELTREDDSNLKSYKHYAQESRYNIRGQLQLTTDKQGLTRKDDDGNSVIRRIAERCRGLLSV